MDRKEMALLLEDHLRNVNVDFDKEEKESAVPKGRGPLKTYILEAHTKTGATIGTAGAPEVLFEAAERFGLKVKDTNDKSLFEAYKGDAGFFFDVLDSRFWIAHTMSNIDVAEPLLSEMVDESPHLDYAWPPSNLMRSIQKNGRPLGFAVDFDETTFLSSAHPDLATESNEVVKIRLGGTGSDRWLHQLENFDPTVLAFSMVKFSREDHPTHSRIVQELNERGRLKAAGNSITLHLQVVSLFLHEYKSLILGIERVARIRPSLDNNGKTLIGDPLVFSFPTPLADFETFVKQLVSCREPLRTWGIVEEIGHDRVHVEGVDLHTGSRLRFDVTPNFLRVYLGPTACGNTVARLLRNLQAHVNSTIRIQFPEDEMVSPVR
jgi:hypothetical protein